MPCNCSMNTRAPYKKQVNVQRPTTTNVGNHMNNKQVNRNPQMMASGQYRGGFDNQRLSNQSTMIRQGIRYI